jgi:hypothetical protein
MSIWDRDQCQVYWGTHGCSLPRGHDGNHYCKDPDETEPHDGITQAGADLKSGFQWDLYGDDVRGDE